MKKLFLFLLATIILFSQCQKPANDENNSSEESVSTKIEADTRSMPVKEEELTPEQQARNLYKNTSSIMINVMMLAFNQSINDELKTITAAFGSLDPEATEESIAEIDEIIDELPEEFLSMIDSATSDLDAQFNEIKLENEAVYNKMFKSEVMLQGISIADSYDLPAGFKPLSESLSKEEMRRYIVKLGGASENTDDVVVQYLTEVMEWLQTTVKELEADPEVNEYLNQKS